ncbi:hypothetical protein [Sulfitobacter sp. 20_GPM-1509m]|uniref:hypothetical protein n=1 Tax=Sulfitobacter sp. 20_GPM-1509m TaxID=1380367 RepID=UPI00048ECBA9|nr:hypothetical protein [Sulfitobacter sp. 20_GPM-1509m]
MEFLLLVYCRLAPDGRRTVFKVAHLTGRFGCLQFIDFAGFQVSNRTVCKIWFRRKTAKITAVAGKRG